MNDNDGIVWPSELAVPSTYCKNMLMKCYRDLPLVEKWALERAACVAYAEIYVVSFLSTQRPLEESYGDLLKRVAQGLEISKIDLESWMGTVRGWHRTEWFYVLYLEIIAEIRTSGLSTEDYLK